MKTDTFIATLLISSHYSSVQENEKWLKKKDKFDLHEQKVTLKQGFYS